MCKLLVILLLASPSVLLAAAGAKEKAELQRNTEPQKKATEDLAPPKVAAHKVVVGVNGMVCSFCAQGIEKKFKAKGEVESVQVDLDNKKVSLIFKSGQQLSDEVIKSIITQEAGYQVVSITRE